MRLKTIFAALALAALPTMGFAACDWGMKSNTTTAATCADGQVYEPTTGTCVTQATS